MINPRTLAVAFAVAVSAAAPAVAPPPPQAENSVLADFARRLQVYVDVKDRAAQTLLPLRTLPDPGEIRRRTDKLADVIRYARRDARQGDIFTPEIAEWMRRAVRGGCEGDYAMLLALVQEDLDAPLQPPVLHGRWPVGKPLPTMLPDLLAELPPLPPGLQYRFMNRALVLLDIDANLIVDVVPDAIPTTTSAGGRPADPAWSSAA
jgi:hypothetical protein